VKQHGLLSARDRNAVHHPGTDLPNQIIQKCPVQTGVFRLFLLHIGLLRWIKRFRHTIFMTEK
jgi:hypothetical protein